MMNGVKMEPLLLDLIFLSEKRKELLLFLKNGPKGMEEIKESLSVTPTSILPQIKKLKEKQLVLQKNKNYELSIIGKVIVEKMEPLLNSFQLFERDFEYWSERDLRGIPFTLRTRLGELGKCTLIRPDLNYMFELNREFVDQLFKSGYVYVFVAYFHPAFTSVYAELAEKGLEISFLLTRPVFQRFETDYGEALKKLLSFKNVKMLVLPEDAGIAGLTVTDRFMLLSLFPKNRLFDRESLMCSETKSLRWGKELFDHLLEDASQVGEIKTGEKR